MAVVMDKYCVVNPYPWYENDLYEQLGLLSYNADADMLQELVKRARVVRVHAFLLDTLRSKVSWNC